MLSVASRLQPISNRVNQRKLKEKKNQLNLNSSTFQIKDNKNSIRNLTFSITLFWKYAPKLEIHSELGTSNTFEIWLRTNSLANIYLCWKLTFCTSTTIEVFSISIETFSHSVKHGGKHFWKTTGPPRTFFMATGLLIHM